MKSLSLLSSAFLAALVTARPRATAQDEPLQESSRITAFVVDDKGNPSVECWEINSVVSSAQVQGTDGSMRTANALSIASGHDLDGVEILTWPSFSDIWPPASAASSKASAASIGASYSLYNVQAGLVRLSAASSGSSSKATSNNDDDDDDTPQHTFSLQNGDDWFYFEDSSAEYIAAAGSSPFQISTVSATETELLRLRYSNQPRHRVVHKGACSFTGIHTSEPAAVSRESTYGRSPLTVQVHIEDL